MICLSPAARSQTDLPKILQRQVLSAAFRNSRIQPTSPKKIRFVSYHTRSHSPCISVFQACCNTRSQFSGSKLQELMSHSCGGQKAKIKVVQGHAPSRDARGKVIPCLFQLLVATGIFLLQSASLPSPPPSFHCCPESPARLSALGTSSQQRPFTQFKETQATFY